MKKLRSLEFGLILTGIALLASFSRPSAALTPTPRPGASIAGLQPGDPRAQVEARWGKARSVNGNWETYAQGSIQLDDSGQVAAILGDSLEIDGTRVLESKSASLQDVVRRLGSPDATGFRSLALYQAAPDYRYEALRLTVLGADPDHARFLLEARSSIQVPVTKPQPRK